MVSFSNACGALAAGANSIFGVGKAASSQQAQSAALNACRSKGGSRCDVKVGFCANAPTLNAKPGLWKLNSEPLAHGQGSTATHCIKIADIPAHNWVMVLDQAAADSNCQRTDFHATSNTIDWKYVCSGQVSVTSAGSIRFDSPQHLSGTLVRSETAPAGTIESRLEGAWIAECSNGTNY